MPWPSVWCGRVVKGGARVLGDVVVIQAKDYRLLQCGLRLGLFAAGVVLW